MQANSKTSLTEKEFYNISEVIQPIYYKGILQRIRGNTTTIISLYREDQFFRQKPAAKPSAPGALMNYCFYSHNVNTTKPIP